MIFLTVGTEYPFDRLIIEIDKAIESGSVFDEVFAQIGTGKYKPENMKWTEMLTRDEFEGNLQECTAVISHAGMGTIIRCIELRKPLLVVPRRSEYGEHVNDHQVATARTFSGRDDLLVIDEMDDLLQGISKLEHFQPDSDAPGPERLMRFLKNYLGSVAKE